MGQRASLLPDVPAVQGAGSCLCLVFLAGHPVVRKQSRGTEPCPGLPGTGNRDP
jgi:hypothetical protein